eukprot:m.176531 g.176531  ORF g.176531 m.176531 type:complete len:198 (+) comp14628_c0_seq1:449-1042(+)
MSSASRSFLESQIGFYAQYHHNTANFVIHVFGVPLLLWSAICLLSDFDVAPVPDFLAPLYSAIGFESHDFTVGSIACLVYALGYIAMEPVAGSLGAIMMFFFDVTARELILEWEDAMIFAAILQVVCWAVQFFGHFVFEKRAPALFDSLFQSIYMAPLFVIMELMFLVGYKPELAKRIYDNAERDIAAWKQNEAKDK